MKNRKYTFGGITFEINSPALPNNSENSAEFLADETAQTDYRILVIIDGSEPGHGSRKAERSGNTIRRYISEKSIPNLTVSYLLASSDVAYLFPDHDAFILHASYIILGGKAILFTAPSGTGKSTQAEYWKEMRGAEIVNGDRVLVSRRDGQFYANGIYASGTSGISRNVTAPLGAVVLLEQGETNTESEIPARMLFLRILCECSYNMNETEQYEKITELVSDMINTVPTLCFRCRNNVDAVDALERILWNKQQEQP